MIVVLIFKGCLSGKSKNDPLTLTNSRSGTYLHQFVIQITRHYFIFAITMVVIEDKTSYSNRYSGCRS